jgi:hypothetical protein
VQSAQRVLGASGPDYDLKRFGLRLARRRGAEARKRAVAAVARKLAVLLQSLWRRREAYEPMRARLAATTVA